MFKALVMSFVCFTCATSFEGTKLNGSWHFKRTDGIAGSVNLMGELVSCTVDPTGKEDNIAIEVGGMSAKSRSCYEGASAPQSIDGNLKLLPGSPVESVRVDFGESFKSLMATFKKLGPAVGPIGGAIDGTCPASATAFLTVDGWIVADPNEEIIGYCLFP